MNYYIDNQNHLTFFSIYNSKTYSKHFEGLLMLFFLTFSFRVLIAAVNKATTNLEVHFFNNCFGDDFTDCKQYK